VRAGRDERLGRVDGLHRHPVVAGHEHRRSIQERELRIAADHRRNGRRCFGVGDRRVQSFLGEEALRLLTAALELAERDGRRALCTMCIGVGQGMGMLLERVR
jgi:Thiolase, C-terminal domain